MPIKQHEDAAPKKNTFSLYDDEETEKYDPFGSLKNNKEKQASQPQQFEIEQSESEPDIESAIEDLVNQQKPEEVYVPEQPVEQEARPEPMSQTAPAEQKEEPIMQQAPVNTAKKSDEATQSNAPQHNQSDDENRFQGGGKRLEALRQREKAVQIREQAVDSREEELDAAEQDLIKKQQSMQQDKQRLDTQRQQIEEVRSKVNSEQQELKKARQSLEKLSQALSETMDVLS